MRSVIVAVAAAGALVAIGVVAACTSASGEVQGGDVLVDATLYQPVCVMTDDAGTGHSFHELYRDYFGNPVTGCGHSPACHADPPNANGAAITHFVCPTDPGGDAGLPSDLDADPDADAAAVLADADAADVDGADGAGPAALGPAQTCYATMTGASGFVTANDVDDPTGSLLYKNLRKSDGTGIMPKDPPCTFSDRDLERIAAWIAAGAKND